MELDRRLNEHFSISQHAGTNHQSTESTYAMDSVTGFGWCDVKL